MNKKIAKTARKVIMPFPSATILGAIIFSIFVVETGVMFFLRYLPPLSEVIVALIDSVLLVVFTTIILYFLWFKKLRKSLSTTEQAFLEEEERLRVIGNAARDAIIMMEDDGNVSFWNPAAETIFGFTRKEILGKQLVDHIIPPEFQKAHKCGVERFKEKGEGSAIGKTIELTGLRKNGETFPIELSLSSMLRGGNWHAIGLVRDITERKQIQEAHLRLVTAVEQSDETVMITDNDGTILYVNPAFEQITGYDRMEVVGENPRLLKSDRHDKKFYKDLWGTITDGNIWKGRFINKRKDGTLYEEEASISPITDDKGQIVNYVAVKRDITKEVSLEKQLHQHQKMEAIGRLAGGIAHDFNNILAGILGYAELAKRKTQEDDPLHKNMEAIIVGGNRAKGLVEQILTFSKKTKDEKSNLSIAPIIKEVLLMLRHIIPKNIEIIEVIDETNGVVFANPNKLHQVMINLCTNATDAMPDGGVMSVFLCSFTADESFCENHLDCKPGEYLKISVQDTGHGIKQEVIDTIFEPFLSTRGTKNTGLGLSVVHGIVQELGGTVMVEDTSKKGTTFSVFLPKVPGVVAEPPAKLPDEAKQELTGNSERILLVDDELMVVDVQSQILTRLGYVVTSFNRSKEALEVFRKDPNAFELVLTDMAMPELTGEQLSRELIKIRPDIPIIVCTGFSHQFTEESAKEIGIKGYLTKPVIISRLSKTIRDVLKNEA